MESRTAEEEPGELKLGELSQGIDAFIAVLMKVSGDAPVPALREQIEVIRKYQSRLLEHRTGDTAADQTESPTAPAVPPPPPPAQAVSSVPSADEGIGEPADWDELARQLVDKIQRDTLEPTDVNSGVAL